MVIVFLFKSKCVNFGFFVFRRLRVNWKLFLGYISFVDYWFCLILSFFFILNKGVRWLEFVIN